MKAFVFVLGKNPDLSLAELVCSLGAAGVPFAIKDYLVPFCLIEAGGIPAGLIHRLGGTLKVAEVFFSTRKTGAAAAEEMERAVDFPSLFARLPEKPLVGVSSYRSQEEQALFAGVFRKQLREHGLHAGCARPARGPFLTHTEVVRKRLAGRHAEFVVCSGRETYVGKTVYAHDPFDFRKRDLGRPRQRPIFSIPPRLARIMVNLSGVQKGILLDPFCGIGGILQEAALLGFEVRGLDADRRCVQDCRQNLAWLEREYNIKITGLNSRILCVKAENLSSCFKKESVDAVVTEPPLGPPLRKRPGRRRAEKIVQALERDYEIYVQQLVRVLRPGGRLVMVTPCFPTGNGMVGVDVGRIAEQHRAALLDPLKECAVPHAFPFVDHGERHRTLRQITVIEKR
jgi:tRNA G10  N-methylase Trm11